MKILKSTTHHIYIVFLICFYIFNTFTIKGQNTNNFEGIINYSRDIHLETIIPSKWEVSIDSLNREISENTDLLSNYSTIFISENKFKLKLSDNDSYINILKKQFHCFDSTCWLSDQLSNRDFKIVEDTIEYSIRGITCKKVEVIHPLQKDIYYYSPLFFKIDTMNFASYKIGDPFFQFICKTGHLPIKMQIGKIYTFILDNFQDIKVDTNEFIMPDKYQQVLIETLSNIEKPNKNYTIGQEKEFLKAFLIACTSAKNLSSFICDEDIQNKDYLLLVNNIGYNQLLSIDKLSPTTFLVKINTKNSLLMDEMTTYIFTITSKYGYLALKLFKQHIDAPAADIFLGNERDVVFWGELK